MQIFFGGNYEKAYFVFDFIGIFIFGQFPGFCTEHLRDRSATASPGLLLPGGVQRE